MRCLLVAGGAALVLAGLAAAWLVWSGPAAHRGAPAGGVAGGVLRVALAVAVACGIAAAGMWLVRQHQRTEQRRFTAESASAVARLHAGSAEGRLAGVHDLARLADATADSLVRQWCIDLLCAYLRTEYGPGRGRSLSDGEELRVRRGILGVIREHLLPDGGPDWHGHAFDLSGARLDGGSLRGVDFVDAQVSFDAAWFDGEPFGFDQVSFRGGQVSFAGARFTAEARFDGAHFEGARVSFRRALFGRGTVRFDEAAFTGGMVLFDDARFDGGHLRFRRARFDGGAVSFHRAELRSGTVSFEQAGFLSGSVSFVQARFDGAAVTFARAIFAGGLVTFWGAGFVGGRLDFAGASFTGGQVAFAHAEFAGGTVDFGAVRAWDTPPHLPVPTPAALRLPSRDDAGRRVR